VADEELTRQEQLDALAVQITKGSRGRARLCRASEITLPYYYLRRPSGLIDLDIATGGGLPAGGLVELIGPEGSCKSWLLNQYLKRQQEIFAEDFAGAVAMTEMHYDKLFGKMHGFRVSYSADEIMRMEAVEGRSFTAEELADLRDEVGTFHTVFADSAESLYDAILDMLLPDLYNVLGIDSWGSLMTAAESKKGMKDKTRGGSAKVNAEFIRRYTAIMMGVGGGTPVSTTVIGVNQMRDSMDPKKLYEIQGGWALKHGKFVSIMLRPGKRLFQNPKGVVTEGKPEGASKLVKVGKVINWEILKGKAGCHDGPTGSFRYFYATGADLERALVIAAQKCGVVETKGSWSYFDGKKKQGIDKWVEAARGDRALRTEIENAVLKEHGIQPNYC
jgi:RecA/RadA recombinase